MPTWQEIKKIGRYDLSHAIYKKHEGLAAVAGYGEAIAKLVFGCLTYSVQFSKSLETYTTTLF